MLFKKEHLPWPLNKGAIKNHLSANPLPPMQNLSANAGKRIDPIAQARDLQFHFFIDDRPKALNWLEVGRLLNKVIREKTVRREVSIRELDGVMVSKSPLKDFPHLYDFGKDVAKYPYENAWPFQTVEDFHANVQHSWPQLEKTELTFAYYEWEDRLYWLNHDGSHHIALAYYQAIEQNLDFKVNAKVITFSVDPQILNQLTALVDIFVVQPSSVENGPLKSSLPLARVLTKLSDFDIMVQYTNLLTGSSRAQWQWLMIPVGYKESGIILEWLQDQVRRDAAIHLMGAGPLAKFT